MQQLARECIKGFRETHWAAERGTLQRRQKIAKRKKPEGGGRGQPLLKNLDKGQAEGDRLGGGKEKVCLQRSKDREKERKKKSQTTPTLAAQLRNWQCKKPDCV